MQAYNSDPRHGFVSIAILVDGEHEQMGFGVQAAGLLINCLLRCWRFSKAYIESLEFNVASFWSGAGSIFDCEGCLRHHEYHDGRYWHLYILSVAREAWINDGARRIGVPYHVSGA